jgi:prephenate dehydratase
VDGVSGTADRIRIVYLGPVGTFTEQALREVPEARGADIVPVVSVPKALAEVRSGAAAAALVPLENSVEGAVGATLDELAHGTPLTINREVLLTVRFDLVVRPGSGTPRTVASHPHGLAQCRGQLERLIPGVALVSAASTAEAAAAVARGEFDAAVCAPVAAESYGLVPFATDVGDRSVAVTRFVLLSRPGPPPGPTGDDLTSLVVFIAHDRTGALLEVLSEFSTRGINLTRIESRPTKERLGRYCFFLDCMGHLADVRIGEALMGLRRICDEVRWLGSYPRGGDDPPVPPKPGTRDADFAAAHAWLAALRAGQSPSA